MSCVSFVGRCKKLPHYSSTVLCLSYTQFGTNRAAHCGGSALAVKHISESRCLHRTPRCPSHPYQVLYIFLSGHSLQFNVCAFNDDQVRARPKRNYCPERPKPAIKNHATPATKRNSVYMKSISKTQVDRWRAVQIFGLGFVCVYIYLSLCVYVKLGNESSQKSYGKCMKESIARRTCWARTWIYKYKIDMCVV